MLPKAYTMPAFTMIKDKNIIFKAIQIMALKMISIEQKLSKLTCNLEFHTFHLLLCGESDMKNTYIKTIPKAKTQESRHQKTS